MGSKFRQPWPWEEQPEAEVTSTSDPQKGIREMLERAYPDTDETLVERIQVGSPVGDLRRGRDGLIRRLREHTGMSYSEARERGEQAVRDIEKSRKS